MDHRIVGVELSEAAAATAAAAGHERILGDITALEAAA